MDLSQLASHSSDSTWEKPHFHALHTIRPFSTADTGSRNDSDLTERAKALDRISLEFQTLVGKNAPLSEVESFTRQWEVASSNGPIVQPNILAWFSDTNALRLACANNNPDVVRFLLQKGLSITPTVINFAALKLKETHDTTIMQALLESGWDINEPLGETRPPLISSILDAPDLVSWCLSKGANPGLSSPSGLSIIEVAASIASLSTVKTLVELAGRAPDGAPVARASYAHALGSSSDRVEVVRYLSDQGYSVDAFYKTYQTSNDHSCEDMMIGSQNALHFAIWAGKEDMVRLLLERGADKTLPTKSIMKTGGETLSPLDLARKFGNTAIIELLSQET
ncbi:ankyrin repeat-containing domain protein [Xylaria bambusicola]|uniref:ankyrin repeat-containing domain protein n=1 Tax=Xylaria bambusicola TaxID=326684 RepID=UPI0020088B4C|nr:ankyrin repeat-containing domain protein [Xylaria bambusicola]KAI0514357.1 ankyrin repeat-containing domain protein [Xylaria bambusicola]